MTNIIKYLSSPFRGIRGGLLLLAACTVLGASAAQRPVKVRSYRHIEQKDIKSVRNVKEKGALITPKGEMKYYKMSCVVRDFGEGFLPVMDVANELYFSEDGKTICFGSLFPGLLFCNELWIEGTVQGDKVVVPCSTPVYEMETFVDEEPLEIHMGEILVDDWGNPYSMQDVEFNKEGDHIYLDYSEEMRNIVLYADHGTDEIDVITTTYNHDMRPYDGNTELNQPSKNAQIKEYIYNAQDLQGNDYAEKGHVAIDGDNYYFDYLLPEATERTHAWIKGVRSGNTITLPNNQYIGHDISYYLYYNGFKSQGIKDNYGQYKGDITEVTFNIDDKGIITLNNPDRTFPCAFYISGNQFEYYNFRHRLEPYNGDQLMQPSDVEDLKINLKMLAKYGQVSISFVMRNLSTDGSYINPDNLYYRVYLDDDVYTFDKREYEFIHEQTMTDIPYAYRDQGNSDIYLADDGRNVAFLHEDMFTRLGVQVIYKVGDKESCSNIVYVDKQNNIEVVVPGTEGIEKLSTENSQLPIAYDLQGRKATEAGRGLRVSDGKIMLTK